MKLPLSIGRYLAKTYIQWFITLYLSIMLLVGLVDLTELLRQASSKPHVTAIIITKLLFLHLPFLSTKLTPFVILFTTFMVLWKLNSSNELTVMRAAGMSIREILFPLLLTVLSIGCFELFIFNPIASIMTERYEHIKSYQFHGKPKNFTVSQSGMWVRHAKDYLLIVVKFKGIDLKKKDLQDVMILQYDDQKEFHTRYHAKKLKFASNETLLLEDGWIIPRLGEIKKFKTLELKNDLDISIIQNSQPKPETISFWQLQDYIKRLKVSGLSGLAYTLHWHSLMAQVVLLLAMVLLAGAFSFKPLRQGGIMLLVSAGLSIGFILYILRDVTLALGSVGTLPAFISAWIPSVISFLCGTALVIYQEDG